jgi:hypothetical protein
MMLARPHVGALLVALQDELLRAKPPRGVRRKVDAQPPSWDGRFGCVETTRDGRRTND